jgi:hypothetical protein
VTFKKSVEPADAGTSNRIRKRAHLVGNPRRLLAITDRPPFQSAASPNSFESLGAVFMRVLQKPEGRR